eukprot:s1037_g1.t1
MDLHFVWQAWHFWLSAGSCDALGSRWRRGSFAWHAWHLETSAFTWCGRRGTWRHGLSLCVAGVALMALSWLLRRAWFPLAPRLFCVARVAFGDINLHSVWQAWHLATWTFTLCGRRGTYGTQLALVTRLVPVGAWHLATWTFTLCGRRGTYGTQLALVTRLVPVGATALLRGTRGIWRHRLSLCVAGVALGDMGFHFVWQAWRLATWTFTLCGRRGTYGSQLALVTRLVRVGAAALLRGTRGIWRFTLCGRRGAWRHGLSLCVAGEALAGSCDALGSRWRHGSFAWHAWHLETSTFTLCGRRGTWRHGLSLCVAGEALLALSWFVTRLVPVGAAALLRGTRGIWRHRPSFRVAGVALGDMDFHFVCGTYGIQLALVTRLVPVGAAALLRGTRGTWRHRPSLCVAGVALGDMDLHFVWQAEQMEDSLTDMVEAAGGCSPTSVADSSTCDVPEGTVPQEGQANLTITAETFGQSMDLLQLTQSELFSLGRSFELLLQALGNDRDRLGDAIYGVLTSALLAVKESFITPRAVLSLALFNGFRVLGHKSEEPEELRLFVETMAFKHLGQDVTLARVTNVIDGFLELMQQNVREMPPGSLLAWRKLLTYTGSCFRYVNTTYGARLKVIQADWKQISSGAEHDADETHTFSGMCAFSMGIMGEEAEGARFCGSFFIHPLR